MELCEALRRAVRRPEEETRRGRPRSLEDVIDTLGGRHGLYSYIAGTSDRSSRAYQAASRRVRRYLQGTRHPSREFMRRVRGAATRTASRERRIERRARLVDMGNQVTIVATITVSRDTRHRRVNGDFRAECWEEIAEALDDGDCDAAEELFSECFGEVNGFGETPQFTDVDVLDPAV